MTARTIHTKELFTSLDNTWTEISDLIASTNESIVNAVPFEGSWTAAQLVTHVTKSNRAIVQGMQMEGKATERNPREGVQKLKEMFLNFDTKFKSPEFIVPENKVYDKEMVVASLNKSIEQLKTERIKVDLIEMIHLPVLGEITKLELMYFVLYHTQRHIHQLKEIVGILEKK